MATTQERIDALEAALAEGVLEVSFGDRKVRYQTIPDMKAAIAYFRSKLATEESRGPVSVSVAGYWRS